MTKTHDYRYDLIATSVEDPEELKAIAAAFNDTLFGECMAQDPESPEVFSTEVLETVGGIFEDDVEEELHNLAMQFPDVLFRFIAEDLDDRGHGYELKYQGAYCQRADLVSSLSPFTPPVPFEQRKETLRIEAEREIKAGELVDNLCYNTDYDLLFAQKQALLRSLETGAPVPKIALEGLINFLDQVGDLGETLGRFHYDDVEPPFPMMPDYQKKIVIFPEEEKPKMHVLCEEMEGSDGIRQFSILGISEDKDELRKLLHAKIDKDEYGFIANNGVDIDFENDFQTEYEDGFVSYYILEKDVLDKTQIQSLLKTPAYDTTFHYPDNLPDILKDALNSCVENEGFDILDMDAAVAYLLKDKGFQALTKDHAWLFARDHVEDHLKDRAMSYCLAHFSDRLDDDPDFLFETGSIKAFEYPGNLKDVIIDCIYDVARQNNLPVSNASYAAEQYMKDRAFHDLIQKDFAGVSLLQDGAQRDKAYFTIAGFVYRDKMGEKKPSVDNIIRNAQNRQQGRGPSVESKDIER